MCRLLFILTLISALPACGQFTPSQVNPARSPESCEAIIARLESAFRSDEIDSTSRAMLMSTLAAISSAFKLAPEKLSRRIGQLEIAVNTAEFRMPSDVFHSAQPSLSALRRCDRGAAVAQVGDVVITVLRQNWKDGSGDWVRAGAGYNVFVDGELAGKTNIDGRCTLALPAGEHLIVVDKPPRESWSVPVDVEPNSTQQLTVSLDDEKEVYALGGLRINNNRDRVLPAPPSPVELSFWIEGARIPMIRIRGVLLQKTRDDDELDVTEDFTLVNGVAKLTRPERVAEFLAQAEGKVILSVWAEGADGDPYYDDAEVWPSPGGVGIEPPKNTDGAGPVPPPGGQIRIMHPQAGIIHYLPEGVFSTEPVPLPKGRVLVEFVHRWRVSRLAVLDLEKTERIVLDWSLPQEGR